MLSQTIPLSQDFHFTSEVRVRLNETDTVGGRLSWAFFYLYGCGACGLFEEFGFNGIVKTD
jgi:hypothetical protein